MTTPARLGKYESVEVVGKGARLGRLNSTPFALIHGGS